MKLKQTFTGADGELSSRKITAFLHVVLMTITTGFFWFKTSDPTAFIWCMLLHGLFSFVLLGIVTVQNIISWKHGYKGGQKSEF